MRRTLLLSAAFCLLAAFPAHAEEKMDAQAPGPHRMVMGPPAGQYRWLSESGRTEIPFELAKNHVVLAANVNGHPLRLVLDTGMPAHGVVLFGSPRSDSIPFDYAGEAMVGGVGGGVTKARMAAGVTVRIGDLELTQQMAIVMPPDPERGLAFGERDGAIGYGLFSRFVVKVDFDRMVVTLEEPADTLRSGGAPGGGTELALAFANNMPRVKCAVELQDGTVVQLELVVDLGASHAVSLNAGAHPEITIPKGAIEATLGRGVGGTIEGRVGRIKSLTLAGRRLENVVVSFRTRAHEGTPGLEALERDGSLGSDALRRFNVTFDYGRKMISLEPNSHTKEPFEYDMAGLEYLPTPDGSVVVKRVTPRSPAEEAGLLVGDVITKVNEREVAGADLESLRQSLMRPGEKVKLTFLRDGKERRATLTLRRIV